MGRPHTLRAVLCDDDAVLRSVLGQVMRDAGYRVVEEVDSADLALLAVEKSEPDVVIVDLALRAGRGEDLLAAMTVAHPDVQAVVFSAFVEREDDLLDAGADVVFHKPDFARLEKWLRANHDAIHLPGPGADRRTLAHPLPSLPRRAATSPSGLEPWSSFTAAVSGLWPGDAVMGLDVLEAPVIVDEWNDPAFLADFRMTIASIAGSVIRIQDRHAAFPGGGIAVALIAGTNDAARSVFERIEIRWDQAGGVGTLIGSFGLVRADEPPMETMTRVLARLTDGETTVHHPLRIA